MINEQENDSDISSITDVQEENSVDTSVSFTSLKTTPIGVLDREDIEIKEIDVIEDDITEIGYVSKEKKVVVEELCSRLKRKAVVGYDITPNQSDVDSYLEKQFEQGYLKKYNNIIYDKKLKRYMILEEGEYVNLNLKRFTKQLLKIMVNSNIEFCEKNEEDEILYKYKDVFASILTKHRVYSTTFRNLHKNIEYLVKYISK